MDTRKLGNEGLEVSAQGLGCMGMSEFYGAVNDEESMSTIHLAISLGVTLFDTADTYGLGINETLVGEALAGRRDEVILATKFGIVRDPNRPDFRTVNGRPEYVHASCENSLRRLGVDYIDLYYQHRVDPDVPIEETIGAMAELVDAGKVRFLGMSEAGAETIRRAHAIHPISALQSEYSLWCREIEAEILPTIRELGIGLVPYSPLGRGMLTGSITSTDKLDESDFRRRNPRFAEGNFEHNLKLVEHVKELAQGLSCTPGQLALAWVLHQGSDVVPIPGTKRRTYLEENVAATEISLSASDLAELDAAMPIGAAAGDRYPQMQRLNR